ncbi:MAG: selenide, water dikinase SelD [Bacteroidia bacterium]|nr:selenide, water dikinase SelD [Bacteroidia bacterium]
MNAEPIRLTQYSHGAGCGCKISPRVLDHILKAGHITLPHPDLIVGHETKDDAAVFDLGDGTALVSTTDFFMPIVDDPYDFGRIASVNAISDVYAMGGTPMLALAILGWPIDKLPAAVANQVLEGSRAVCRELGIPLAGGHSIDSPEPIFGLAVSGRVNIANIRKNSTALPGNKLFLTKPLGVGILTTAQKKGKLRPEHEGLATGWMLTLNKVGEIFARHAYVKAMTDVTGFGLLGHLSEMCEGARTSAVVHYREVPRIAESEGYITEGCIPGGTNRNWESFGDKITGVDEGVVRAYLCDPQTSGGLLVAVVSEYENEFIQLARGLGLELTSLGYMTEREDALITVK